MAEKPSFALRGASEDLLVPNLSCSFNAFMLWAGLRIACNGTRAGLEHLCRESVYVNGDGTVPGARDKEGT